MSIKGIPQVKWLVFLVGLVTALLLGLLLVKVHLKVVDSSRKSRYLWTQLGALFVTNLVGIILGLSLLCRFQSFAQGHLLLSELTSEAWKVADMVVAMNVSTRSFDHNLDRLYSECPSTTHEFLGSSITEMKGELKKARAALAGLHGMLEHLPGLLLALADRSRSLVTSLTWCQVLPLLAIAVCFVALAMLVFLHEPSSPCSSGPTLAKRCSCFQLPCLASSVLVPVLILVAGCGAAELLLAVFSSTLCRRPETTMLNYVNAVLGSSATSNLTVQYIHNATPNGAVENLHVLQAQLSSWDEWVTTYGVAIQRSCPAWDAANVSQNLQAMISELDTAVEFAEPSHLTLEWTRIHHLVCGVGISDLVRLMVMTLLLGFVCLPLLACSVSCLLEHLVAERGSGGFGYAFNLLSSEDADQSS
ncbi:ATJ10 [Symbiodinium natans]|uniref:ATJ10 protein n=1 Tax=Symbiodinium natans TaxID=878477 RepID=A0A812ULX4_9DINO|nr:ATJ10 [Symbiodinium natans]